MFFLVCGCGKKEEPAPKEVVRPVKVITVKGGGGGTTMTYPGKTRANRRVDLSFKVPGPLVELPVEEGQEVKKGQLLARILPRDFKITLDQAKARAIEADRQYDRYKELYVRKQVSKAEFDRYKASRDVAAAQLEDAQNALKDTYLKAPFDGIVAKRYVENFQEVQAKQPIVFFQDLSRIEVLVDAPETVVATLRQGEEIEATATFSAAPDRQFPLELKEFSTEADPQTQTYQVVLVMDRPEGINVLPGMTATVTGKQAGIGCSAARIVIPAIAVTEGADQKPYVWVLESQMTVSKKGVRVGEMTGSEDIVILEGLSGGEKIVTSGVTKLKEGMQVSIWKE
ncbi:hemolysin D [Desulfosarcina alkanivorans]|uniref:Hemolysin D n=1 Tax=Desulfosarcina alkanivorans TaxID=571177 RepID=A0A5K7YMJ2_9BACT|nr:efflux RND transporter periplasmic adaptor subunit [Desulfosarcina alkanivorans]BBO69470.1 hemolysin D [Desulfosarcina alkanivorans]